MCEVCQVNAAQPGRFECEACYASMQVQLEGEIEYEPLEDDIGVLVQDIPDSEIAR